MRGTEQDARIILDQILCAIAVMHIKIHDGDAGQPMMVQRMFRPDRDIAKKTKPHRRLALGMMTRRADGGKGVRDIARQDQIDCQHDRPGCAVSRRQRAARHMRIGIQCVPPSFGCCGMQSIQMRLWMRAQQIILRRQWRLNAHHLHPRKRTQHGIKPRHLFGMARWGHMAMAIIMKDQRSCHAPKEPNSMRNLNHLLISQNTPRAERIKVYSGASIYPSPRTVCRNLGCLGSISILRRRRVIWTSTARSCV